MTVIPPRPEPPLTMGISECLLGAPVRYDGSDARASFPYRELDHLFTYRGICPEIGIGMTAPRPPIHLVARDSIRAVAVHDGTRDFTEALQQFGEQTAAGLGDLAGYLFTRSSPSCGLQEVKVHDEQDGRLTGAVQRSGRGIYAEAICRALPDLPVEENGRLHDAAVRESFLTRTFAFRHFQAVAADGIQAAAAIEFHSRYKYLLMAHSVRHYQAAGRLLSNLKADVGAKALAYRALLMEGLGHPASRGGHANVLAHLQGYLKRRLDGPSRQRLANRITAYRLGEVSLAEVRAVLSDHLSALGDPYLLYQTYLAPFPGADDPAQAAPGPPA